MAVWLNSAIMHRALRRTYLSRYWRLLLWSFGEVLLLDEENSVKRAFVIELPSLLGDAALQSTFISKSMVISCSSTCPFSFCKAFILHLPSWLHTRRMPIWPWFFMKLRRKMFEMQRKAQACAYLTSCACFKAVDLTFRKSQLTVHSCVLCIFLYRSQVFFPALFFFPAHFSPARWADKWQLV